MPKFLKIEVVGADLSHGVADDNRAMRDIIETLVGDFDTAAAASFRHRHRRARPHHTLANRRADDAVRVAAAGAADCEVVKHRLSDMREGKPK
jgi:fatty acid desaturase